MINTSLSDDTFFKKGVLCSSRIFNLLRTNDISSPAFQPLARLTTVLKMAGGGFPGGAVVENLPANVGDTGSSPGLGRSHMPRSN